LKPIDERRMKMAEKINDKVALVTGASRGIGRASAIALAQEGAHVVVTARTQSELDTLADEIRGMGVKALAVAADASSAADVDRVKKAVDAEFGTVDILVNNAGVAKYGSFLENTVEDYDWMMNTNVRSTFLFTHAFLPAMVEQKSGAVIIVSSQAGLHGYPGEAVYCATKFAQVGFAEAIDKEYRDKNIKVSVIAPGGVNTYFAFGTGRTPGEPYIADMLEAESVADAVVFAAKQSPKSRILIVGMRPMSEST
jgi:3-oxoacyl-[acyl-carrier protein] reductase